MGFLIHHHIYFSDPEHAWYIYVYIHVVFTICSLVWMFTRRKDTWHGLKYLILRSHRRWRIYPLFHQNNPARISDLLAPLTLCIYVWVDPCPYTTIAHDSRVRSDIFRGTQIILFYIRSHPKLCVNFVVLSLFRHVLWRIHIHRLANCLYRHTASLNHIRVKQRSA